MCGAYFIIEVLKLHRRWLWFRNQQHDFDEAREVQQSSGSDHAPRSNLFKPRSQKFVEGSQLNSYSTQLIYVTVNNVTMHYPF